MKEKIKIEFKGKVYNLDKVNLEYFISRLEGDKKGKYSEDEIIVLMEKYGLYTKDFLEGVCKIG